MKARNKKAEILATVIVLGLCAVVFPRISEAATGSIRVCKMIADQAGNIVNGSAQPGVTFREQFFSTSIFDVNIKVCTDPTYRGSVDPVYELCPAAGVPGPATFTTPLTLNTKLAGFPNGPGVNGNNAQCVTYSNLPMPDYIAAADGGVARAGFYFYKEETISGGNWKKPLYNDTFTASLVPDQLLPYSYAWFDNDASNNPGINNRNNEGSISIGDQQLTSEQATDPANRTLLILNQYGGVAATPTPTPKPTVTPTPTPVPTPTPTPTPTPRAPQKAIGKLEGLPLMLTSLSKVNKGAPYWVKITVFGFGGTATVDEKINGSNFTIIPPNYSDATYGTTFRITKPSAGYEAEIQDTICPGTNSGSGNDNPSCVSNVTATGFKAALGTIPTGERRFVYFKVLPTNTSNGTSIDASGSTVTYSNYPSAITIPLGGPVTIENLVPFFQVFGGDVWSASPNSNSIISLLTSSTQYFANTLDSIVFHLSGADFGVGEVSPKLWEAGQYPKISNPSYDEMYAEYKKNIIPTDVTATILATPGYYESNTNNGKLVLKGSDGWGTAATPVVVDKKIVIFVNGDLYLDKDVNIQIKKDGKSSLSFIVKGRIGIDPSITSLQGIYMADGIIDTACVSQSSAEGNSNCSPGKYDPSASAQLTLEGVFSALGGFNLDRTGTPGTIPGEKFVYRPDLVMGATEILGKAHYTWKENIK